VGLGEAAWFMSSDKTFCDLAPGATQPLESALRLFRDDFERHMREGGCTYPPRGSRVPVARGTTW
jgi:NADH-quinone oxidoreductase subunit F